MPLISINKVCKWFDYGNVMVTGEKGSGKDVMFGNVIARRKKPYISNLDYTNDNRFIPLDLKNLEIAGNTYRNFIDGNIIPYKYPYPQGADIFISDAGIYFPSHYTGLLDKEYKSVPTFWALQRHVANSCSHANTQAFGRVWNKLREQASDVFIRCQDCRIIFGKIVIARFTYYDKASSCEARVRPCRYKLPMLPTREMKQRAELYFDNFYNTYGTVTDYTYICINKSKHDTRIFRNILQGVVK